MTGEHGARKVYLRGTHRTRSPADTIRHFSPVLKTVGVTRLANVTGLDYVGIPVFTAVRPNAKSLSVSQGKGVDAESAKASAMMEAIEVWHAENVVLPRRVESYHSLKTSARVTQASGLVMERELDEQASIPWVEGRDLLSGQPIWVPLEVMNLDYVWPDGYEPYFEASSNGLASGNDLTEATVHGLCEVIERDAVAKWFADTADPDGKRTQLDLASIVDPVCREVLDQLQRANLRVAAYDSTSALGIPTYSAVVFDRPRELRSLGYFWGFGTHLAPEVALSRALTEAVQCRLTEIVGNRDDIQPDAYLQNRDDEELERMHQASSDPAPTLSFASRPSLATDSPQADLEVLLAALRSAGAPDVSVVDLSRPDLGVPVVKVVVPGLEDTL